ncbi:MAG: insulinase family protein [Candidatus Sericytochromatia bacterium]|nr:insulinase family protein [Candidatus Sericytochromatia bacterium]
MTHHRPWASLLAVAMTVAVTAGTPVWAATPAPPAAATAGQPTVRQFTLANGLKVLLVPNHAAPVVTWMVSYKVGSRNESTGTTGSAHLLEHMLFKGTKDLKKGQIARLLTRYGASFNATTGEDTTRYFETYGADKLELGLRIEASRMRGALILDTERQPEMSVVRSELEIGENDPSNLLYHAVQASAFTSHPYHHPVIGWRSDVETVKTEQLREFYNRYYQPNNAVAVLVGDFDPAKAEKMVRQYFNGIPKGATPPEVLTKEETQRGERRVIVRRQGERNLVQIAYHLPAGKDKSLAQAEVIADWLNEDYVGPLYQELVETQLATSTNAYLDRRRDASLFWLEAEVRPGVATDKVEKALLAIVDRVVSQPIPADALQRAKTGAEANAIYRKEGTMGQAAFLTEWEMLAGDWRQGYEYQQALQAVTAASLQQLAKDALRPDNRTVGHYISDANAPASAKNGGATAAPNGHQASADTPLPDWQIAKNSQKPKALQFDRIEMPNGMSVLVSENHANPTATISGFLRLNAPYSTPQEQMIGGLTGAMLDRGTQKRSKEQMAKDFGAIGGGIAVSGDVLRANFNGKSLTRDLGTIVAASAEMMRTPAFSEAEFAKVKQQIIAGVKSHQDDAKVQAAVAFSAKLFPVGDYRRALSPAEQIATVQAATLADVKAFHKKYYGPKEGALVVVGDVTPAQVKTLVAQTFGDWDGPTPGNLDIRVLPARPQSRQVVNMPDKSNVVLSLGNVSPLTVTSPDFATASVLNRILGGDTLTARLGRQIRDVEGLTYGIYSSLSAGLYPSHFQIQLNVNPANVDAALKSVDRELRNFVAKGVTDSELASAKLTITGTIPVQQATNAGVAGSLVGLAYQRLPANWYSLYPDAINKVTKADIARVAKTLINPDQLVTVIAGPYTETAGKGK